MEHALVGPEEIQRRDDDAGRRHDSPPAVSHKGAQKNEEFANESVEARNTDRGEHHEGEDSSKNRCDLADALELRDLVGVATGVKESEKDEQSASRDAVVDHLQHRTFDAFDVQCEQTHKGKAHVGHRRISDETLEVALHGRDDAAIDHTNRGQGQHHWRKPHRRFREQFKSVTKETVGAKFQKDAGQID